MDTNQYVPCLGRKSWLVPTQYLLGLFMLYLSMSVNSLLQSDGGPQVTTLTAVFFLLAFLAATQVTQSRPRRSQQLLTFITEADCGSSCRTSRWTAGPSPCCPEGTWATLPPATLWARRPATSWATCSSWLWSRPISATSTCEWSPGKRAWSRCQVAAHTV